MPIEIQSSSLVHVIISLSSTRSVIGQFYGLYFTVRPAKLESCSFPVRQIDLRDIKDITS